ncbi:autotransporter domain-containing protein [Taklimakanibacter deserti]|uniref:autotransporter domain-containing protein n=1 Tax=Taklimakanibacter deserti TaxID=2267839 RepID=UPI0013C499CE
MAGKIIWLGGTAPRALAAAAGGFLLAQAAMMAPAHADPCIGAADDAHSTVCANGSTNVQLTYPDSNEDYEGGDFTLRLDNHDVVNGGILFEDLDAGDGTVTLQNGSDAINAGGSGIDAKADEAGEDLTINVETGSSVTGGTNGINVLSEEGNVTVKTEVGTSVSGGLATANTAGINAVAGEQGSVSVTAEGTVSGRTGIFASADSGTVSVATGEKSQTGGSITGIHAQSNQGGAVTVTTGKESDVQGSGQIGIEVGTNAGGDITVTTGEKSRTTGVTEGIQAIGFNAGAITVNTGAGSEIGGGSDDGIDATSFADGVVKVTTGASAKVNGGDNGIEAASGSGNVSVTIGQGSETKGGLSGIKATTGAGAIISVTNDGTVAGTKAGIEAASGVGAIQMINRGTVANVSGLAQDLAILASGGSAEIDNTGLITGRIETGGIADKMDNDGTWTTRGTSNFGAGADVVNNNQKIAVGTNSAVAETARFQSLETLNNAGKILLADQAAGAANISDRLETSGNYVGQAGAELHVDASLGGPASLSDVLAVGGNTSGVTRIVLNDINLGPGAFNPTGILVVDVAGIGHEGDFVLANGPIDKGLFVYDLVFNNTDQANDQFRLVSSADEEVFETLATVASSQEIWRDTANAWEGRQQVLRDRIADRVFVSVVADPPLPGDVAAESSLWFQALGSWTDRNARISGFDLDYSHSVYGFVAGADAGISLGDDGTFILGVLAGYVDSSLDFDQSSTSIKTEGATLGVYASFLTGGFFANILLKADVLDLDYSAPSLAPANDHDNTDVASLGGRADIGFRFGESLFVEPMLSLDAISTKINKFSIGGSDIDPGTNDSMRGGAGLRLGIDAEMIRTSVAGRVWDVFDGDNEIDIISTGPVLAITDDTLDGVYGEVVGQIDLDLSSSTVLFARGSYLFSDDISKPSVSGGLSFFW